MEFTMKFDGLGAAVMTPLGAGRKRCRVVVTDSAVTVIQSWAFRTTFPRSSVVDAGVHDGRVISRGAHGWSGRWLVNGAGDGLVRLRIEPAARARVIGVPVRLRELTVSVDDPAGLVAALA